MQNRKLHCVTRGIGGCIAVLIVLAMFVTPIFAGDWADGFNGNINNWSVRTGSAMSYSTTYSKGGVTGAGSMAYNGGYSGAMWRSTGGRPSYTGIIKAQFYDSQMIRPGLCGNWHRMMIGASGTAYATGLAAVGMYSTGDRNSYFIRNNSGYANIGQRGQPATCGVAGWVYYELEFKSDGKMYAKAQDAYVARTHNSDRIASAINNGITHVTA